MGENVWGTDPPPFLSGPAGTRTRNLRLASPEMTQPDLSAFARFCEVKLQLSERMERVTLDGYQMRLRSLFFGHAEVF